MSSCVFRVATDASGRGVLRLILFHQRLSLLSVLAVCMQGCAENSYMFEFLLN